MSLRRAQDRTVEDRREHLDAVIEVALHEVGAPDQAFLLAAVMEVIDAAVLQEAANLADDANVVSRPGAPVLRQQIPRTGRSTRTPSRLARYSSMMRSGFR